MFLALQLIQSLNQQSMSYVPSNISCLLFNESLMSKSVKIDNFIKYRHPLMGTKRNSGKNSEWVVNQTLHFYVLNFNQNYTPTC